MYHGSKVMGSQTLPWCGQRYTHWGLLVWGQGPYLLNHVFNWADTLHTAKPTLDKCLEQIINLFECVSSQIWIFNCLFGWIFGGIYSPPGVWDPLSSWNTVLMEVIFCKTLAHSEVQLWGKEALKKTCWFKSYGHDRALGRLLWHMPNMYPPLYKEVVNTL